MSGASRLPPRLLRVMGKAASFVSPALRRMMGIVDLMNEEMHAIWGARKAALRDGKQGTHAALLDVLRKQLRLFRWKSVLHAYRVSFNASRGQ